MEEGKDTGSGGAASAAFATAPGIRLPRAVGTATVSCDGRGIGRGEVTVVARGWGAGTFAASLTVTAFVAAGSGVLEREVCSAVGAPRRVDEAARSVTVDARCEGTAAEVLDLARHVVLCPKWALILDGEEVASGGGACIHIRDGVQDDPARS